jgi:hypothetical protein
MLHNFKSNCISLVLVVLIAVTLLPANLQSQTRVTTKSGNTFIGFIQSSNDVEIELISLHNEKVVIPKSSVIKQELLTLSVSTKSGLELNGTLTRISDFDFELKTSDGILMTIRFDGVEKFRTDDPEFKFIMDRKIVSGKNNLGKTSKPWQKKRNSSNSNIPSEFIPYNKSNYQKFGLNFGSPAIFNVIYGYTSPKLGFHLSGGYWADYLYGFQIGPSTNFVMAENYEVNLVVAFSILKLPEYDFKSYNIMLDANIYGLHLELGMGLGEGNVESPLLLFQVGYAIRWRK